MNTNDEKLKLFLETTGVQGFQHAAEGLSGMLGEQIMPTRPATRMVPLVDIPNVMGGPEQEAVGIYLQSEGDLVALVRDDPRAHRAAALAQIGEFSFILAELGLGLGLLPEEGQSLILAGALISITLNPVVFWLIDRMGGREPATAPAQSRQPSLAGHQDDPAHSQAEADHLAQ